MRTKQGNSLYKVIIVETKPVQEYITLNLSIL